MDIAIKNLQKRIPLSPGRIRRILTIALAHEKVKTASLSIAFVTDRKIQTLNRKFHKRDFPTDVLAFNLSDPYCHCERPEGAKQSVFKRDCFVPPRQQRGGPRNDSAIVGEIIISTDTVSRNAKIFNNSPGQEIYLCLVHGVLHLLGYDDHAPRDIRQMRVKEQQLLALIRR